MSGRPRDPSGASRPLTVLFAPDSFKGSLTSVEVARALADGWRRARPSDTVLLAPLADGGEGTLVAIEAAGGWNAMVTMAKGPLGARLDARWLRSTDGTRAVVELAAASGLSRVPPAARKPLAATTDGTGEILRAVLDAGIHHITLGIGGSATTDGGSGILRALGARFSLESGEAMPASAERLLSLGRADLSGIDARLCEVDLQIACDVTNPLLGPNGAAAVYGPQKGAGPDEVSVLDAALTRYADILEAETGRSERDTPGAGAAGGTAFGLLCLQDRFRSLELVPGIALVMEETDLDGKLHGADLVLTGEGRIDAQTAFGKTALGVALRARAAGVGCVAIGGGVEQEGVEALAAVGVTVVPVVERPMSVESAMAAGSAPLERCGERIARLVSLAASLT